MSEILRDWDGYYKKTEEYPPRPLLIEAVKLVLEKEAALDLGAGALNDTEYLLNEGFEKVVAIDKESAVLDRSKEVNDERLQVIITPFELYEFPPSTFDIVNAQYSIPFVSPELCEEVMKKIFTSLKEGGIFTGQLFGNRDGWINNLDMTFHTKEEIDMLFSGMKEVDIREIEKDGETAGGEAKHWHFFNIIARK